MAIRQLQSIRVLQTNAVWGWARLHERGRKGDANSAFGITNSTCLLWGRSVRSSSVTIA